MLAKDRASLAILSDIGCSLSTSKGRGVKNFFSPFIQEPMP